MNLNNGKQRTARYRHSITGKGAAWGLVEVGEGESKDDTQMQKKSSRNFRV